MRHALTVALQGFEGALVLVSHDRHLMNNTVDEFFTVHQGRVTPFEGDLDDYARWMQEQGKIAAADFQPGTQKNSDASTPKATERKSAAAPVIDKKEARKQAANQREQLAPLRREVRTLEKTMDKLSAELSTLEDRLGDATLYEDSRRDELTELLRQQGYCKAELSQAEESWLEKSTQLEELSSE